MTLDAAEKAGVPVVRKSWPLLGYAPGNYMCTCAQCGEPFTGNKRAIMRLPCAAGHANLSLSALDAAKAEVERLTRERDVMLDIAKDLRRKHPMRWKFDMIDAAQSEAAALRERVRVLEAEQRLGELHVEALAEIKAAIDGASDQPVRDIIYGLLAEIATLTPTEPGAPDVS